MDCSAKAKAVVKPKDVAVKVIFKYVFFFFLRGQGVGGGNTCSRSKVSQILCKVQ